MNLQSRHPFVHIHSKKNQQTPDIFLQFISQVLFSSMSSNSQFFKHPISFKISYETEAALKFMFFLDGHCHLAIFLHVMHLSSGRIIHLSSIAQDRHRWVLVEPQGGVGDALQDVSPDS
jgi:hypothetical protein